MTNNILRMPSTSTQALKSLSEVAFGRLPVTVLLLVLSCLLTARPASAQNVQFTQGNVGSGLDSTIQIPITAYPGRGAASLPVTLYYSSKVWRIGYLKTVHLNNSAPRSVAEAIYSEYANAGWTTSLDLPVIQWPRQDDLYFYDGKAYHNSVPPYTFRVANVFIHMPDGSVHELRRSDQVYADSGTVSTTGVFYAVDSSRLRYDSTSATTGTLYMPDGSRYELNGATARFVDRNGNALNYDAGTRKWTDTLGQTLRGDIGMPWPASPQATDYNYTPPGFSTPYTFKWRQLSDVLLSPDEQGGTPSVKAISDFYLPQPGQPPTNQNSFNFPQAAGLPSLFFSDYGDPDADNPDLNYTNVVGRGQAQGQTFNPVVLSEVVLPNGLSYKFYYNVYGEIDKVVYPTGGFDLYKYGQVGVIGNVKPPYTESARGIKLRQQSPEGDGTITGTWIYEGGGGLIKVTAPDGTRTESYRYGNVNATGKTFGYEDSRNGLTFEERVYDSNNVMLRRTLTEWTQTSRTYSRPTPTTPPIPGTYTAYRNPRPVKTVAMILDTNGGPALAKKVTYQYDTTFEMTTGIDQTGVTESHFAENIDQTTAQGGPIDTLSNNYYYPPANSTESIYLSAQSYRDRNILGLTSSVTIRDAAGQAVSKTETFYDEAAYPLVTYGDLGGDAGYSDPGGATVRGNPTTVRRYIDLALNTYLETHAQFDQCGNAVNFWNERGLLSQDTYSSTYKHAYLTQTATAAPDPNGIYGSTQPFTSTSTYDTLTGQPLTATDANGQLTSFSYANDAGARDPLNRLRKVSRPDGGWTKYDFNDVVGNLYVHTEVKLDATGSTHTYQFFDRLGRSGHSLSSEGGGNYVAADTEYDASGRVKRVSNPYRTQTFGGTIQATVWTTSTYDALGRIRTVTVPDGTAVQTDYVGLYTTVTDQAGRQRRQKTDALGRVVRVDEPDAGGSLGTYTSPAQPSFYEYDTLGNIVRINQGLTQQGLNPESADSYTQHRFFKYDALSRPTYERQVEQVGTIPTATDALTGNAAWSRRLVYDETVNGVSFKGLLTSAEDARHVVTRYYYDQISRTYQVTYTDGSPTVTSKYDQAGTGYFNRGRLTEVTTGATASAPLTSQLYDYDLMGRAARQRQVVDANTYTLTYAYNLSGGLTAETYPSGKTISYGYDSAARLQSVSGGGTNYASSMVYKPFGALESTTFGNGAIYSLDYNSRLQMSSINLTKDGNTVQRYEYKYGRMDMATGTLDESKNSGQVGQIEGFIGTQKQWQQRLSYDSLGRLSSASEVRGDNGQQSYLLNYDYDVFGNRFQKQTRNQGNPVNQIWVEDNAYNTATNRFVSGVNYDDAGNVLTDSRFRQRQFLYDANNRQRQSSALDGSGAVNSVYDGAGQRVATKANGVLTSVLIYDAFGKLVAEYGGSVSNGGTQYVLGDQQGSIRVVMRRTPVKGQIVISRHDYLPFGEEVPGSVGMRATTAGYGQPDSVRQKYAGMETDDATGMNHTLWREFDNLSARWTAPDPYGGSMELLSPQSFNRYSYVNNDPANRVDPSGLMMMWGAEYGWNRVGWYFADTHPYGGSGSRVSGHIFHGLLRHNMLRKGFDIGFGRYVGDVQITVRYPANPSGATGATYILHGPTAEQVISILNAELGKINSIYREQINAVRRADAIEQLKKAGLYDKVILKPTREGFTFQIKPGEEDSVRGILKGSGLFKSGNLYGKHVEDAMCSGGGCKDYRSPVGTFGDRSLQVVYNSKLNVGWADTDAHNPYQFPAGTMGHLYDLVHKGEAPEATPVRMLRDQVIGLSSLSIRH